MTTLLHTLLAHLELTHALAVVFLLRLRVRVTFTRARGFTVMVGLR